MGEEEGGVSQLLMFIDMGWGGSGNPGKINYVLQNMAAVATFENNIIPQHVQSFEALDCNDVADFYAI